MSRRTQAAPEKARTELFELSMLGGPAERRYRRLRPELLKLPWGTLASNPPPPRERDLARRAWTEAAFQEHRTGVGCALTLASLISLRAPLDLVAMASRFPLDELVHVEMCARLAMELGGAAPLMHQPDALVAPPLPDIGLKLQTAELVVRFFCVGEAISIPLLRAAWHAAKHPLVKGVLGRIVKDEAAHGQFGWMFLDWLEPELDGDDLAHLSGIAVEGIAELTDRWDEMAKQSEDAIPPMGWMSTRDYLVLARASLKSHVIEPLAKRGIRTA